MGEIWDGKMKRILFCCFCLLLPMGGCYYTVRSTEGHNISTAEIEKIKLGKTTEADLFKILGSPAKKEPKPDGTVSLLYIYSEEKSLTLPGGFAVDAIVQKEEEIFEITLKDGAVLNYHFLRE